jgi:hypothetical protein
LTFWVAVIAGAFSPTAAVSGALGVSTAVILGRATASGVRGFEGSAAGVAFPDGFAAEVSVATTLLRLVGWLFWAGLASGLTAAGGFAGAFAASGFIVFLKGLIAIVCFIQFLNFNFGTRYNTNEVPHFKPSNRLCQGRRI